MKKEPGSEFWVNMMSENNKIGILASGGNRSFDLQRKENCEMEKKRKIEMKKKNV